ncbi:Uncharacterised protein [Klebsiella michiganensis]|uniref:Uncharacterized protein n=1 Tax=Klebsiella michiganensis TaxID=1134687 RepID=A0A7H4MTN8_9ENTR|nr:Uncharacterised protein [Klebsiella michiganensis]
MGKYNYQFLSGHLSNFVEGREKARQINHELY